MKDKQRAEFIDLGKTNTLSIYRETDNGFYLISDDDSEEVLLPASYKTPEMKLDDLIDVFIYTDSEDRLVATTETPLLEKDEYAFLEVVDVVPFGAFVDIGLQKDILVPRHKQARPFEKGEKKVIKLIEDDKTNRLIGTEKFQSSFLTEFKDFEGVEQNQKVEIIVYMSSPLGYKVIVNNLYSGLVYENEVFEELNIGDKKEAYIKKVREDGKLDISLQPIGNESLKEVSANKILEILKVKKEIPFTTKSNAELIQKEFGMSKKSFKRALNYLNDNNLIKISEISTKLLDK